MDDRVGYIRVINKNDDTVVGRYAGKDYHFKRNVPLDVPEIVANHVFGFGMDDKSQALNRLGWARSSDELTAGMEMLSRVEFADPPEMIEAPPKPKKAKAAETGAAGPPVTAGGTEGGVIKAPPNGPKIGAASVPGVTSAAGAEGDATEF
jgi:hypothetical protein